MSGGAFLSEKFWDERISRVGHSRWRGMVEGRLENAAAASNG